MFAYNLKKSTECNWRFQQTDNVRYVMPDAARTTYPAYKNLQIQYIAEFSQA
ncbi:hypothetical protein [Escherichia sp. 93.0816]|uniref:hypothetical protein n=1 Tax=Escherichia sp. 93.0816 TaxID=2723308 RepID=UPI001594537A|nr:hypothetical protein [Escherichia sp. 93.0816]EFH7121605.1 hypothetical protein [Escherichia coli]MBB2331346.1 hypothetical protein [Escherichia sp. 93.0816]QMM75213.1 hypothetical protein HVW96_03945 [Escherichia coli]QMM79445.1 hypothetical protein HVW95_03945 [Escherichia coli]